LLRFEKLLLLSAFALPLSAHAQAWQCRAPNTLPRPKVENINRAETRRVPVGGYTLALSWSREFCRNKGNRSMQCNSSIGDFGFILHGLWPDGVGPKYPQYCRGAPALSMAIVKQNICMSPDVQLLQHSWTKHGTCMARRPETYFKAARVMYGAIVFPDMDRLSRQYKDGTPLTADALANAFSEINQGLPANALRIKTNGRGWLQEVRMCLAKNFKPRRCPAHIQGARGSQVVKIWRG
jgi:ribonuclease T2